MCSIIVYERNTKTIIIRFRLYNAMFLETLSVFFKYLVFRNIVKIN